MSDEITQDGAGFRITAGERTETFVVGIAGDGRQRDVSFLSGEASFTGSGLGKLIDLGLWQHGTPSAALCRSLLAEAKIDLASLSKNRASSVAANVGNEGPAAKPPAPRVPATLEQLEIIPGAKEFPKAAIALANSGATLEEAKSVLGFAVRESVKNNPNRATNSPIGLIFNPVEL
jgi:hypothetical protein